jgi:quaternary ammonium compound-resistance protein SugE
MPWLILFIAGLFEVMWAALMKMSQGFTLLWPSLGTVAAMTVSIVLLGWAMKSLPLGTAYAVWTGIGAVGSVLVGILFLGESHDWPRLFFLFLILAGLVGLKLVTK